MSAVLTLSGWDTASVWAAPLVNAALRSSGFGTRTFSVASGEVSARGKFSVWQVIPGGGGNLVFFSAELFNIVGSVRSKNTVVTEYQYSSLIAEFELRLDFAQVADNKHNLVVDPIKPPAVISALRSNNPSQSLSSLDESYIKESLLRWLEKNLAALEHVFATVELFGIEHTDKAWSFCRPTSVGFSFVNADTIDKCYLSISAMTEGRSAPKSYPDISPSAMPKGCQGSFVISPDLFMRKFLLSSVSSQLEKLDTSDFESANNGLVAKLKPGRTEKLQSIKKDGKSYCPVLRDFKAEIINSEISIFSKTSTSIKSHFYGSVTAYSKSTVWYTMELGTCKLGRTILFKESQPSVQSHSIHKSTGFKIIEAVTGALGGILVLIGTVATDGLALVITGTVLGLLSGGIEIGVADLEEGNQDNSPSVDLLLANTMSPIQWHGHNDDELIFAGLKSGALLLGTKPKSNLC